MSARLFTPSLAILHPKDGAPNSAHSAQSLADVCDLESTVSHLGESFEHLRHKATYGFTLVSLLMALAILLIFAGAAGDMLGFRRETSNLIIFAGIIVEIVSGLGLYLFTRTIHRFNSTAERFQDLWRLMAAFKKAESLPEGPRADMVAVLINRLVEPHARSRGMSHSYIPASRFGGR